MSRRARHRVEVGALGMIVALATVGATSLIRSAADRLLRRYRESTARHASVTR